MQLVIQHILEDNAANGNPECLPERSEEAVHGGCLNRKSLARL
jgi:hypothetical protein